MPGIFIWIRYKAHKLAYNSARIESYGNVIGFSLSTFSSMFLFLPSLIFFSSFFMDHLDWAGGTQIQVLCGLESSNEKITLAPARMTFSLCISIQLPSTYIVTTGCRCTIIFSSLFNAINWETLSFFSKSGKVDVYCDCTFFTSLLSI